MFDLFDNVWGDKPEVVLDHCIDITLPVAQTKLLHQNSSSNYLNPQNQCPSPNRKSASAVSRTAICP